MGRWSWSQRGAPGKPEFPRYESRAFSGGTNPFQSRGLLKHQRPHYQCVAGCVRRPVQRSIVADSCELLTGLVRKSFMPASRQR